MIKKGLDDKENPYKSNHATTKTLQGLRGIEISLILFLKEGLMSHWLRKIQKESLKQPLTQPTDYKEQNKTNLGICK